MVIIEYIRTLDFNSIPLEQLCELISAQEFKNADGNDYSAEEVQDLIKPLIDTNQSYDKLGFGSCGINRESNPCGDASDY